MIRQVIFSLIKFLISSCSELQVDGNITWVSHHQSPVHISSKTRFFPSSSIKCFCGTYSNKSLNIGFPINSFIHSTGSRLHNSSLSRGNSSPSSVTWFPRDVTISHVHLVAWVGSESIFFKKFWLFVKLGWVRF